MLCSPYVSTRDSTAKIKFCDLQIGDKAEYEVKLDTTLSNHNKPKAIQVELDTTSSNNNKPKAIQILRRKKDPTKDTLRNKRWHATTLRAHLTAGPGETTAAAHGPAAVTQWANQNKPRTAIIALQLRTSTGPL